VYQFNQPLIRDKWVDLLIEIWRYALNLFGGVSTPVGNQIAQAIVYYAKQGKEFENFKTQISIETLKSIIVSKPNLGGGN
jgi:hypothetical protein